MRFMLLMQTTPGEGQPIGTWPPADIKTHIAFMHRFNEELKKAGELVTAEGLGWPDQARIVRAGKGGVPAVTDGPFPEAKEFLMGFWIIDCESAERAVAIAARVSAAPGVGGVPLNMPIQVRQVMSAPPQDM
jgi:hypothetical protein